ncbi:MULTISPECIES: hypothetical protein [unclassified Actinotalea]|uniref:hypothetical protein n=1 Tax=unclassified Actinotalea TaxID=2638618 RepID=UPI0015F5C3D1|nr:MULTISPECIES: hypothetical protein [unclassified Actinotalea]
MDDWLTLVLGLAALIVSAAGGWPLTSGILALAARSSDAGAPDVPASPGALPQHVPDAAGSTPGGDGPVGPDAQAALRGGTWIGILERLAITGSILAGYPSGIALVIAVKGLGRYPELREHPGTSERFVIGTLASMLWAAVVGAVVRRVLAG